ncbi:peptide-methionine (S)-S-oxide reductase MsrA [Sphingobacterium griseoflavum]|uniref:Peptide methionine sulfoxide reductase MsrA n=1 Tax=Sphingobacterium griseoflavum TaxID=1474952 RepID=A0ABQ3HYE1_9SPHI|nr:peptide-methionine (S)-S-oxide reductase MsrA [Sphingobacterium griseoflavum]GHE38259.1 peptide methionine sulfoxide reductase MsrA [Sphingobacterium griseoflavum]
MSNRLHNFLTILLGFAFLTACAQSSGKRNEGADKTAALAQLPAHSTGTLDTATFGAGCFWCVEAQFATLKGVKSVLSGYSGGKKANPTYSQVSSGRSGHAEVIQVLFDTATISYDELLEAFFLSHDPTQLDRQGNDVGPQYRSVIFAHTQEQFKKSQYYIDQLNKAAVYKDPIVTAVEPFAAFYKAEDYHQQYYEKNGGEAYCVYVIKPKMEKFRKVFKDKLKTSR